MQITPGKRRAKERRTGFSMVELLVTIVIAGIAFAAFVPLFVNVLGATARTARRNDAQLIVQDRIEQVRLLPYANISQTNLNDPPSPSNEFGDGRFGTSYTLTGQRAYPVNYIVEAQDSAYRVTVAVTTPDGGNTASMTTVVKDPAPGIVTTEEGGGGAELPTTNLSITCTFKNWRHLYPNSDPSRTPGSSYGVYYTRTDDAGHVVTSTHKWPTAADNRVLFTGLDGGKDYTYEVYCYSYAYGLCVTPPFHLLKSARPKFDTNPGGS